MSIKWLDEIAKKVGILDSHHFCDGTVVKGCYHKLTGVQVSAFRRCIEVGLCNDWEILLLTNELSIGMFLEVCDVPYLVTRDRNHLNRKGGLQIVMSPVGPFQHPII